MQNFVFDHCESSVGDANQKNTYIPDGTYDGLEWNGRTWNLKHNVMIINELKDGQAPIENPIK